MAQTQNPNQCSVATIHDVLTRIYEWCSVFLRFHDCDLCIVAREEELDTGIPVDLLMETALAEPAAGGQGRFTWTHRVYTVPHGPDERWRKAWRVEKDGKLHCWDFQLIIEPSQVCLWNGCRPEEDALQKCFHCLCATAQEHSENLCVNNLKKHMKPNGGCPPYLHLFYFDYGNKPEQVIVLAFQHMAHSQRNGRQRWCVTVGFYDKLPTS